MPAMLIYSIFMLVESTIMLNTMLTVVAEITGEKATPFSGDIPMATADSDMHPDATTVLNLKAFYFLEQVIPDMQEELPAYLAAAEGVSPNIKFLEWWDKQEELPHLGGSLAASPAAPAIIRSCQKSF